MKKRNPTALVALIVAASAGLAACDPYLEHYESIGPAFGEATSRNFALQIANPDRPMPDESQMITGGDRMNIAITNYRTGKVVKLEEIVTSEIGEE
jgi:type IV pilus biogenesis protein CpaD/CtpE